MRIFFIFTLYLILNQLLQAILLGLSSMYINISILNGVFFIEFFLNYVNLWFIYYMGYILFILYFFLSRRIFSYMKLYFSIIIYSYIYLFISLLICSMDVVTFIILFESIFFPISIISLFYTFSNRFVFAIYILIIVSSFGSVLCILFLSIFIMHYNQIYIDFFIDFVLFDNIYLGIVIWLLLFIVFGIKYPIWPLHTWLPEVHVEVSTELSILLASIILKVGFFGVYKYIFLSYIIVSIWFIGILMVMIMLGLYFVVLKLMMLCDYKKIIAHWSVIHTCIGLILVWHNDVMYIGLLIFCNFGHILSSSCMFAILGLIYDSFGLRVFIILSSFFGSSIWSFIFLMLFIFNTDGPLTMLFFIDILVLMGLINFSFTYIYILFFVNMGTCMSTAYVYLCVSYFTFLWNNKYYRVDLSVNDIYLFSNLWISIVIMFYYTNLLF